MNNSYFPFNLTPDQDDAVQKIDEFLNDSEKHFFILKGYAGTGKTTLLSGILKHLDENEIPFRLLAPTGRAARVLEYKTGNMAQTIHSALYVPDKKVKKTEDDNFQLHFKLRQNSDVKETVYFVDEASMIADKAENNPMLLFDDGRLLDHFFRFTAKRKVIFIGDEAQLPPVNCSFSAALTLDYLKEMYKLQGEESLLTTVKRQSEGGILRAATLLRQTLRQNSLPPLQLKAANENNIIIARNIWDMIYRYSAAFDSENPLNQVFVSFSNGGVHYINNQIRNRLFSSGNPILQQGELLTVAQNNHLYNLNNGQQLVLESFTDRGEKTALNRLVDAILKDPETGEKYNVKLVYDLLFKKEPNLTIAENNELMKDFAIRMQHEGVKHNDERFFENLMNDKRLNSVRAKFGYAITCHKAQGGEWNNVFLNLEPALDNLSRQDQYRWLYTSVTRAAGRLIIPEHDLVY